MVTGRLPLSFLFRRLHSLTGVFLALFLFEHLLTNSQASLYLGENGKGFIDSVNWIHSLPFLGAIEILLLGVPIFIHLVWGLNYLFTSLPNSSPGNGTKPSLPKYSRNHAYTWQRITSWILVFGLLGHVIQMRFVEYPDIVTFDGKRTYSVVVEKDEELETLSRRLDFKLAEGPKGQMIATANDFGTASLLVVRDTFKMPIMITLYTLFVLAACFHGYNGLWTALITWGVSLTERSQMWMRRFTMGVMVLVAFFGLMAIFGT